MKEKKERGGGEEGDKMFRFGSGSKLTFKSCDIQSKVIDIINKETALEIIYLMKGSIAWALIADTTPSVSKHEQLSLCL